MSAIFWESWDHYNTSQLTTKWNSQIGVGLGAFLPPEITTDAGRKGYGLAIRTGGSAWKAFQDLSIVSVGLAWRPMGIANKRIFALRDEESIQVYLQLSAASKVQVYRGNGQLLGTSAQAISAGTFYHLELRVVLGSTTGAVTLRINGDATLGFSATNVNTQVSSFARVNILQLGDPTNSPIYFHYDDIFITDGTMLGPQFVDVLRPNGGVPGYMDMAVVGAGSHYQAMDETTPDDDTTYVYSSSPNLGTLLSEFEDIREPLPVSIPAASGAIAGLAVHTYARKEYGNTRGFRTGVMPGTQDGAQGSIVYFDNAPLYMETENAYHSDYYTNNPGANLGAGGTWTIESINALRAGFSRYV